MSVNTMSFQQAAAILTSLTEQMTGESNLAVQNLSDYISVGQKALRTGYDPLSIGISQMVSKTLFAYRPYQGALSILDRDNVEWGAITRKLNSIQQPVENSGVYGLTDGQHTPDMFDVRKPKLYQTNFYGFDVWADHALTQLDIDQLGLDNIDRRLLRGIIEYYGGGPVGLDTLAATINEETITIEDVYEPYLLQQGFLTRTPRGRCATKLAYTHLGLPFPGSETADDQLSLID